MMAGVAIVIVGFSKEIRDWYREKRNNQEQAHGDTQTQEFCRGVSGEKTRII